MEQATGKVKVEVKLIVCETYGSDSGDWWTVSTTLEFNEADIPLVNDAPTPEERARLAIWRDRILELARGQIGWLDELWIAHLGLYYWHVSRDNQTDDSCLYAVGDRVRARFTMDLLDNSYKPIRIAAGALGTIIAVFEGDIQPCLIEWDNRNAINNCDPDELERAVDQSPQDGASREAK